MKKFVLQHKFNPQDYYFGIHPDTDKPIFRSKFRALEFTTREKAEYRAKQLGNVEIVEMEGY